MNENTTTPKTLWSETIIELLCIALENNNPDKDIKELLRECRNKGFKSNYLINKVKKEVGEKAALRIKIMLKK